ncbi:TPA: arsenic resistance protein [Pseudomonas aeruginosa]|uniref:arsenic resistance protein n=1 Tax=Pseudomonas aeruginosa TaxID=287 RepID=UPI00051440D3|nr:arsenic resistance protein [Pseudomonas aeruginosa]KHE57301.1 arsenic resistance protein [Pseudomonas aeruginosa]KSP86040.1 arsenic resistance protein [Pseudomonas aeruginosa]MBX6718721.1 arsenic resistance protein [Pseudomonas aeruginosa]MBX6874717.1 arsenic resistance protein [Pseudomonas aeruginosa]WHV52078.1 arsenic resistance protein [Pseudomonas aeruginosa]
MSRDWLEQNQIGLYFVAVAVAALVGLNSTSFASLAAISITPTIAVLMYAMFLQIPFLELRQAFANRRFVGALLLANFVFVPLMVWLITLPLATNKALLAGALLVLLTPCIDYVVVFTHLGKGDSRLVLAATPLLLLLQLLLLPLYLQLMLGADASAIIDVWPFVEAFLLLIVLPLVMAVATEFGGRRSSLVRAWSAGWAWLPVPAMAIVLVVVVGSQISAVVQQLDVLAPLLPVYGAFLLLAPVLGAVSSRLFGLSAPAARAVAFSSATRNSLVVLPLALALPESIRGLAAAAVITQTLVELVGELIYLRTIPALVKES